MIVQAPSDRPERFVITMREHTALAGEFARAFGNDRFEPVAPREPMLHVVANHDAGWAELDARVLRDPATGLPYHLVDTPFEHIIATSSASPEINSRHDPFCGLLSSMHSWGLYNGRYGLSDKVLLDDIPADRRAAVQSMLDGELERQGRLKEILGTGEATAAWIEPRKLMQSYKQLQFFDTLALYFNCGAEGSREPTRFAHVPFDGANDTAVTVRCAAAGEYVLDPFPFGADLAVSFDGRWLAPAEDEASLRAAFSASAISPQTIRLVARTAPPA